MLKTIFFAVIIYGAYLLLRYFFRAMASKGDTQVKQAPDMNPVRRRIDPDKIEDAEFEEIKKD